MLRHNADDQRQVAIAPAAHPLNDAPALRGVVFAKRHARGVVTRGLGWKVSAHRRRERERREVGHVKWQGR